VDIFGKVDAMSRAMADTPKRRPRRQFTDEFKASAVRLVLDEGKSVGAVARDLDLTETALREWVKRAQADRTRGRTGLTSVEREELVRLRKALRIAEEERDILKNQSRATMRPTSRPETSVRVRSLARGRDRQLFGVEGNPLKNLVRGRPAHM
jgi:transposase